MTSTTSERGSGVVGLIVLAVLALGFFFGIWAGRQSRKEHAAATVKTRIPAFPDQVSAQEPPKPTTSPAVQADQKDDSKEYPYFGSTYWDELLTSVYYYPKSEDRDTAATHLQFNHRDDDIWLCGDQRKSFEPGTHYRLTVTFEPNQPCVTNWKTK